MSAERIKQLRFGKIDFFFSFPIILLITQIETKQTMNEKKIVQSIRQHRAIYRQMENCEVLSQFCPGSRGSCRK